jgi:hypothetical protein
LQEALEQLKIYYLNFKKSIVKYVIDLSRSYKIEYKFNRTFVEFAKEYLFKDEETFERNIRLVEKLISFTGHYFKFFKASTQIVYSDNSQQINSISGYLAFYGEGTLTLYRISLKKVKENIVLKKDSIIMELQDISKIGLLSEENKVLAVYKGGIYKELDFPKEIQHFLIKWLREEGILFEIIEKYGFIFKGNEFHLNLFSDFTTVKKGSEKVYIGYYNPKRNFMKYFLPEKYRRNIQNAIDVYTPLFEKEMFKAALKNKYLMIILSYGYAMMIKDLIKDYSSLSLIPHLYMYSLQGGTEKTTLLEVLRVLHVHENFHLPASEAQFKEHTSVYPLVLIDEFDKTTDDVRNFLRSILKTTATGSTKMTNATGEIFHISANIVFTSNFHPKMTLSSDEALFQRLIILNVKEKLPDEIIKTIYKTLPSFKTVKNNVIAMAVNHLIFLKRLFKKENLIDVFSLLEKNADEVYDKILKLKLVKDLEEEGYKVRDSRFASIIKFILIGFMLSYLYYKYDIKVNEINIEDLEKELTDMLNKNFDIIQEAFFEILKNNEAYAPFNIAKQLISVLVESHLLTHLKNSKIISNFFGHSLYFYMKITVNTGF